VKQLIEVVRSDEKHWVGDGFPVRTLFSYSTPEIDVDPFLLLDYAGPAKFEASSRRRGVGEHPHRGFETVTIVYDGEVEHRDSAGNGGRIGKGDVQWMTAASGVVHEEMHGAEFTRRGGTMEMVQLWVNLPARLKMSPPRYQTLLDAAIPAVELPDGAGALRVIAGSFGGKDGPAKTFTPIDLWDLRLAKGSKIVLPLGEGRPVAVLVRRGALALGKERAEAGELARFGRPGEGVLLEGANDAGETSVLVMSGQPIDEPVVGWGPFVMNTEQEIRRAIADYRAGKLGQLAEAK
jgi:redox-sensitive bicupin YhaK (pirin superfamily)